MQINDADVAELVDARDLKSLAATDIAQHSCKTSASAPVETAANPAHLQNNFLSRDEVLTRLDLLAATEVGGPIPAFLETPNTWGGEVSALCARAAELVRRREPSAEAVAGQQAQQALDAIMAEIDTRLRMALHDAGRSALGMPGTVDTFKAMLHRAGLVLVLA